MQQNCTDLDLPGSDPLNIVEPGQFQIDGLIKISSITRGLFWLEFNKKIRYIIICFLLSVRKKVTVIHSK